MSKQIALAPYAEVIKDMYEALVHAEAILTYTPHFSTNKSGKGPDTSTKTARDKVRAAIAKAQGVTDV
jgi:hypothetical protein